MLKCISLVYFLQELFYAIPKDLFSVSYAIDLKGEFMITLLLVLAMLGLIAYAVTAFVPMPVGMKNLIIIVAVLAGILYSRSAFGVGLPHLGVPVVK